MFLPDGTDNLFNAVSYGISDEGLEQLEIILTDDEPGSIMGKRELMKEPNMVNVLRALRARNDERSQAVLRTLFTSDELVYTLCNCRPLHSNEVFEILEAMDSETAFEVCMAKYAFLGMLSADSARAVQFVMNSFTFDQIQDIFDKDLVEHNVRGYGYDYVCDAVISGGLPAPAPAG